MKKFLKLFLFCISIFALTINFVSCKNDDDDDDTDVAYKVYKILQNKLSANSTATSFEPSSTAPASGTKKYRITNSVNTVAWLDGTTIYYYAKGYTDSSKKIPISSECNVMFSGCTSLVSIDMTGFDTSKATSMWGMFSGCENLATLTIDENFSTGNVKDMEGMFNDCKKLTNIDVSGFDVSKVKTMKYMFHNCISLTSLDLSAWNTSSLTSTENMFGVNESIYTDASQLKTITFGSNFNMNKVTNANEMFEGLRSLTTIYAPSGTDWSSLSNLTDSSYMFSSCWSLKGGNGTNCYNDPVTNSRGGKTYTANVSALDKTYARIDKSGQKGLFTAK